MPNKIDKASESFEEVTTTTTTTPIATTQTTTTTIEKNISNGALSDNIPNTLINDVNKTISNNVSNNNSSSSGHDDDIKADGKKIVANKDDNGKIEDDNDDGKIEYYNDDGIIKGDNDKSKIIGNDKKGDDTEICDDGKVDDDDNNRGIISGTKINDNGKKDVDGDNMDDNDNNRDDSNNNKPSLLNKVDNNNNTSSSAVAILKNANNNNNHTKIVNKHINLKNQSNFSSLPSTSSTTKTSIATIITEPTSENMKIFNNDSFTSESELPLLLDEYQLLQQLQQQQQQQQQKKNQNQSKYSPPLPPNVMSRTQQKLWLQRQYYQEDNENCLKHPKNQARLTKVTERINREHGAITLYRDPMVESLHRVFNRYAQEHPEVLEDDFGVGYEDAKEWHLVSDGRKNLDNSAHSILSAETLTTVDPVNNNTSQNLR